MLITAGKKSFDIDVVVFDKDGLLFESKPFFIALAMKQYEFLRDKLDKDFLIKYFHLLGFNAQFSSENEFLVSDVNTLGPYVVAATGEEPLILITLLIEHKGYSWTEAKELAFDAFEYADRQIRLEECLKTTSGFPQIFERLQSANVPFGIATSDNAERAIAAISCFYDPDALSFVISPAEVSNNKPDRESLDIVAQMFNTKPERIMMIGDSYVDVLMAKNAGAIGIGIPEYQYMREKMLPYATVILDSLNEIKILEP